MSLLLRLRGVRLTGSKLRLVADIGIVALLLLRILWSEFWVAVAEVILLSVFAVDAVLVGLEMGKVEEVFRILLTSISLRSSVLLTYVVIPVGFLAVYFGFFYSVRTAWVVLVGYSLVFALSLFLGRYVPVRRSGWSREFLVRCPLGRFVRGLVRRYPVLLQLYDATYLESQVATVFATLLFAPVASYGALLFIVSYGFGNGLLLLVGVVLLFLSWLLPFLLPRYVLSKLEMKRMRIKEELPWFLLAVLPRVSAGRYYVFDEAIVDEFEAMRFEAKRYREYYEEYGADYAEALRRLLREAPPIEDYRSFLREYIMLVLHPSIETLRRWANNWLNTITHMMTAVIDEFINGLSRKFQFMFTVLVMMTTGVMIVVFMKPELVISLLMVVGLCALLGGLFGALMVYGSAPVAFRFEFGWSYVPFLIGFVAGVVAVFFVGLLAFGVAAVVAFGVAFVRGRYVVSRLSVLLLDLYRVVPLFVNYLESGFSSDSALVSVRDDVESDRSYSGVFKRFLGFVCDVIAEAGSEEALRTFQRLGKVSSRPEHLLLKTFPGKLFIYTVVSFRERVERDVALMIESVFRNLEEQWKRYQLKLRGLRMEGLVVGLLLAFVLMMAPGTLLMFSTLHGAESLLSQTKAFIGGVSGFGGYAAKIGSSLRILLPLIQSFFMLSHLQGLLVTVAALSVMLLCLGVGVFQDASDYGLFYPRWSFVFAVIGLLLGIFTIVKGASLFSVFLGG